MKVRLSPEVLEAPEAWSDLDRIVQFFLEERHQWDAENADAVASSRWITSDVNGRAGVRSMEVLEKSVTAASWGGSRGHSITVTVDVRSSSTVVLSPRDAFWCLCEPAHVVVENSSSDGAFLFAMVHAFERRALLDGHTERCWALEHLGGFGEVAKRLDEILAASRGPVRVLVLADSDARFPGEETTTMRAVRAACTPRGIPYVLLKKRKIENYIPLDAFQVAGRLVHRLSAYASLTPEQRDHYDLKKGLPLDLSSQPKAVQELYGGLSMHVRQNLAEGFGSETWKAFADNRDAFTARSMLGWCASDPQEIERLLDGIEQLL